MSWKWHKWWYNDWANKGVNCIQKDKWKHQWASVLLSQNIWVAKSLKTILDATKESKEFNVINKTWATEHRQQKANRKVRQSNCRFCCNKHEPCRCPVYGKSCARCIRVNHYEEVYGSYRRFQKMATKKNAQEFTTCANTLRKLMYQHRSLLQ